MKKGARGTPAGSPGGAAGAGPGRGGPQPSQPPAVLRPPPGQRPGLRPGLARGPGGPARRPRRPVGQLAGRRRDPGPPGAGAEARRAHPRRRASGQLDADGFDKLLAEAVDGQAWRLGEAQQMLAFVERVAGSEPAILLGDFDAFPEHERITLLRKAGFVDAFASAGRGPGITWDEDGNPKIRLQRKTYPDEVPQDPLDRLLARAGGPAAGVGPRLRSGGGERAGLQRRDGRPSGRDRAPSGLPAGPGGRELHKPGPARLIAPTGCRLARRTGCSRQPPPEYRAAPCARTGRSAIHSRAS